MGKTIYARTTVGMWLISGYKDGLPVVKLKASTDQNRMSVEIVEGSRVGYGFGGLKQGVPADQENSSDLEYHISEILEETANFLKNLALIEVDALEIESVEL